MSSGFIYLWRDRKHQRFYVGSHWGPTDDAYICSSRWMRKAYRLRPADFKRRVLAIVTSNRLDLLAEEQRWLNMIKPSEIKRRYYNVSRSVKGPAWYTDEDRRLTVGQKIARSLKGRKNGDYSEAHREAIRQGKLARAAKRREETGFSYHPEFGTNISEGKKKAGHHHTDAHKELVSRKLRKARAKDPLWDHKFERKCPQCGEAFMGRESQKYCSFKCSKRYRYLRGWPSHVVAPENRGKGRW